MAPHRWPWESGALRVRVTVSLGLTAGVTAAAVVGFAELAATNQSSGRQALTGIVLATSAGIISALLLTRTLLRAVGPLEAAAREVAATVDAAGGSGEVVDGEIKTLAGAYRQLALDLAARRDELASTRAAFRHALSRLGDVLASTHDMDGIVEAVVETSLLVVPADAAVFYRAADTAWLVAAHARGIDTTDLELHGTGMAGAAAARRSVVMIGDPGIALDAAEPNAVAGLAAPVLSLGRLVGVLALYGTSRFSSDDVGLVISLIRQAEVAIANIELHEQARRDALTDGVTGLWNRRHFDLRLRDALAVSQRFGEPFGVVLLDLDDFKRINDSYDHSTGDAALIHFAAILRRSTREVDVVCRWGGEEFAVLLQRTGPYQVDVVANRILEMLRESPLERGADRIPFTVSAGVASYPWDGGNGKEVLEAADAALLRAKANGKDRVERAEPTGPRIVDLSEARTATS